MCHLLSFALHAFCDSLQEGQTLPSGNALLPRRNLRPSSWALWWEDTLDLAMVVADTGLLEYASRMCSHHGLLVRKRQMNLCCKPGSVIPIFDRLLELLASLSTMSSSTQPPWRGSQGFYFMYCRESADSCVKNAFTTTDQIHHSSAKPLSYLGDVYNRSYSWTTTNLLALKPDVDRVIGIIGDGITKMRDNLCRKMKFDHQALPDRCLLGLNGCIFLGL